MTIPIASDQPTPALSSLETKQVPTVESSRRETGFYEPYANYHKSVRLWFLAYGIGAPVFLVQFPGALEQLKAHGSLRPVAILFLVGVAIQVGAALLYKSAMWYLYMEELESLSASDWRVRASEWLSEAYWLETLFDGCTLAAFLVATWRMIAIVT